jgi:hypothetical protein
VGIAPAFGGISKGLVEREGRLPLAFRAFHSPGISTALRDVRYRRGHPARPQDQQETMPPAIPPVGRRLPGPLLAISVVLPIQESRRHKSSLLSRISSLNCHPSKLINMRPNSCHVISRPSTLRSGTEPLWESSHSILPRTTR